MFKSKATSLAILGAFLALSPLNVLKAHAPAAPSGYIEKSATKTEAGEINFNLLNVINEKAHANQKIVSICEDSQTIVLENGSRWQVSKIDAVKGWDKSNRLILTHNHLVFSSYKFALVNVDLGLAVPVSMVTPPQPNSDKVLYVKHFDITQDIVQLNNDVQFIVNSRDHSVLNKLNENGQVLIGVNTHDGDLDYPYLLLDASLNSTSYVRCNLLNP